MGGWLADDLLGVYAAEKNMELSTFSMGTHSSQPFTNHDGHG